MIQKKVCMVGVFGTGKTSLVQRFVHSLFSERYLSTVGVKIDRKPLELDGTAAHAGALGPGGARQATRTSPPAISAARMPFLYVADGTRKETCDQLPELRALAREAAGEVPEVLALNKTDLTDSVGARAGETRRRWRAPGTWCAPAPRPATASRRPFSGSAGRLLATREARS